MPNEAVTHVYEVADRVEFTEGNLEGSTTALTPTDIRSLRERGYFSRDYRQYNLSNFKYIGRRKCSGCKHLIDGPATYIRDGGDLYFCYECYIKLYSVCSGCGTVAHRTRHVEYEGAMYCNGCFEDINKITVNISEPKRDDVNKLVFSIENIPIKMLNKSKENRHELTGTMEDDEIEQILVGADMRGIRFPAATHIYGLKDGRTYQVFVEYNPHKWVVDEVNEDINNSLPEDMCLYTEYSSRNDVRIGLSLTLRREHKETIYKILQTISDVMSKSQIGVPNSLNMIESILKLKGEKLCVA